MDTAKHVLEPNVARADFVFDVDLPTIVAPTLKLPINVGENPYDAAERFLETNGLDPGYREQVVNFITQNVGEDAFKNAGSDVSADPFTGTGRVRSERTGLTIGAKRCDDRRAGRPVLAPGRCCEDRPNVGRCIVRRRRGGWPASSCPRSRTSDVVFPPLSGSDVRCSPD